jgi:hypothetical protein
MRIQTVVQASCGFKGLGRRFKIDNNGISIAIYPAVVAPAKLDQIFQTGHRDSQGVVLKSDQHSGSNCAAQPPYYHPHAYMMDRMGPKFQNYW